MNQKLIVSLFLFFGGITQSFGQGRAALCLYCEEPDKTYKCSIIGSGQINPQITKLYCLMKTAKEQNHARCRVKQSEDALCVGSIEVTYLYEGPNIPGLTKNIDKNSEIKRLSDHNAQVKARNEPRTLAEMTEKSLGQTKENLKKVGKNTKEIIKKTGKVIGKGAKTVGGAVKGAGDFLLKTTTKTVKCIFTIFNKCSDEKVISNTSSNEQVVIPQTSDTGAGQNTHQALPIPSTLPNPPNVPMQPPSLPKTQR